MSAAAAAEQRSDLRILYVCHEPLPSPHTNTEQMIKTATALARVGCWVDFSLPGRREMREKREERVGEIAAFYGLGEAEIPDRFRLVELPVPRVIRGNAVRPWHDMRAARFARGRGYDVLYTRDPFSLAAGLALDGRVAFETYRFDLNERAALAPWRRFCYRRPSLVGVVTHSQVARASFLAAGLPADGVIVAHNGGGTESMRRRVDRGEARAALGLGAGTPLVVYAGHVDPVKGLGALLRLARDVTEATFVIVGHMRGTAAAASLERDAAATAAANVRLVPRVPPADVARYLFAADVLAFPPTAAALRAGRTVLPMKTFQYLAAGRAILAPDLPDLREVLRDGANAVLVPPDAPDAAAAALRALLGDAPRRERLAAGALEDARRYTWDARAGRIAAFLRRRLGRA